MLDGLRKTQEPKFLINNEDQTYTLTEMQDRNDEHPEVVREIEKLLPGEHTIFGGGAEPITKITRII